MQSFLSGPQSPSSHAVPTGRLPDTPPAPKPTAAAQGVNVVAQQAAAPKPTVSNPMKVGGLMANQTQPTPTATGSGNKWNDLNATLGGINLSSRLFGGPQTGASLLGATPQTTDWNALMGYGGTQQAQVSEALRALGITRPTIGQTQGLGSRYSEEWLKSMGLM